MEAEGSGGWMRETRWQRERGTGEGVLVTLSLIFPRMTRGFGEIRCPLLKKYLFALDPVS